MAYQMLDQVSLTRALPEHRLAAGAVGTVVHVYPGGALEVEFFSETGRTITVVTVTVGDVTAHEDT